MKYAVVKVGGSQFLVKEGEKLTVDRISVPEGKDFEIKDVLLLASEGKLVIGTPTIKGQSVKSAVEKHFLGDKLDIFKFKAKTGYRRKTGFRSQKTLLKIEKI